MTYKKLLLLALAAMSFTTAQATVLKIDGGAVQQGDCTFACVNHYQQVYDNKVFGNSPMSISSISFIVSSFGGTWTAGNKWQMSVSTVGSNAVNNLKSNFSSNLGANNQVFDVESFSGAATTGSLITFKGLFNYNPLAGDLLIDIVALGSTGGPTLQYNSNSKGTFSRDYSFANSPTGALGSNYGNVTVFGFGDVVNVPEPTSLALLGLGLVGLVGLKRSRRKSKQA